MANLILYPLDNTSGSHPGILQKPFGWEEFNIKYLVGKLSYCHLPLFIPCLKAMLFSFLHAVGAEGPACI